MSTKPPAAYPDPQDPGRTTLYEPSDEAPKTDQGALDPSGDNAPATPSEKMAHKLEEEE